MLTPQQIQDARNKIGVSNPASIVSGQNLLSKIKGEKETFGQDIKGDFLGIGKDILSGSQKRAGNISQIQAKKEAGTKSKNMARFETAGQLAGSASDAIGSVFKGAAKMVLTPKAEAKVKDLVTNFGQEVVSRPEVQSIIKWYDTLPEDKQDALDAVGGFASLAGEFVGVGVGQKVAKQGVKATKQGARAVSNTAGDIANSAQKVVGDIIPSTDRIVNYQVTRALDLTQGDVKNISLSTGNEVGEFLAKRNLIGSNKETTQTMVKDFYDTQYKTVRDEISKVNKSYDPTDVPRFKQALTEIKKQVGETSGLEDVTKEIDTLLKKDGIVLDDVQRVKELMDDHFSLYKVTGDVKEGVQKEGLTNLRKDLKEFIEKEVKDNTGADIAGLNNDVSTSRSILNAVEERATRGLTSSNIKLGDLGVFGLASTVGTPLFGLAALAGKKILESSAIRLRIAKYLDRVSDAKKLKIQKALEQGKVPEELKPILKIEDKK